jgi:predicted RNase H-like HicB family nuclease
MYNMKDISYYMKLNYPVEIKSMPDGMYCAEIKVIPGLCAYGASMVEALEELKVVKTTAFELMLKQGKDIPLPKVHLEIPVDIFEQLSDKDQIEQFVVV